MIAFSNTELELILDNYCVHSYEIKYVEKVSDTWTVFFMINPVKKVSQYLIDFCFKINKNI